MNPQSPDAFGASTAKSSSPSPQAFTSQRDRLSIDLKLLSADMQGSLRHLIAAVDAMKITPTKGEATQLKQHLQEQLARLNEGAALLGTMLETNSSEILHYVKKRHRR